MPPSSLMSSKRAIVAASMLCGLALFALTASVYWSHVYYLV